MDLDCTPSDIREENEMNIKISIKNGKNMQFRYIFSFKIIGTFATHVENFSPGSKTKASNSSLKNFINVTNNAITSTGVDKSFFLQLIPDI
jgi:hypothetical protein